MRCDVLYTDSVDFSQRIQHRYVPTTPNLHATVFITPFLSKASCAYWKMDIEVGSCNSRRCLRLNPEAFCMYCQSYGTHYSFGTTCRPQGYHAKTPSMICAATYVKQMTMRCLDNEARAIKRQICGFEEVQL